MSFIRGCSLFERDGTFTRNMGFNVCVIDAIISDFALGDFRSLGWGELFPVLFPGVLQGLSSEWIRNGVRV